MNFFKSLFTFLFHKDHVLTKKIHSLGAVIVTTCLISIFLLGVNGFASSSYAATNKEEQGLITAETESAEIEDLVTEEEELIQPYEVVTDTKSIQAYKEYYASRLMEEQVVTNTLSKLEKESVALSTAVQTDEDSQSDLVIISAEDVNVIPNRDPIHLTNEDYEVLLKIVEAEVGTEDLFTRTMIANVIINRMQHDYYPDTIKEVVFQNNGKVYQFSPILDGRYFDIKVTSMTREAVDDALAGYDNSKGALAFVNRSITSDKIMAWFDNNLIFVTKYGPVEYFTF